MDHVPLSPLLTHPLVHQFQWILLHLLSYLLYHSSTIPNLDYQSCITMNYNNEMMTLLTDAWTTPQIQEMHTS
jgi:hypothetical protein